IIKKCTDILQDFRDGKITKAVACSRITQTIPTAFVEGGGVGEQAAHTYFEILDRTKKELVEAAKRRAAPADRADTPPNGGGRHRSRSASPNGESGSKRRRVNNALLPWVVEPTLSPELAKTRSQLVEFAKDPKYVLGTNLNSTRHIAFPESEWLAIIKGQAVDLNKVISSQFSVSHERQHAESIGDGVEIPQGFHLDRV
ncbi:hypothetical protein B0H13DRAFT_1598725, partial [Mycena leptocephala]